MYIDECDMLYIKCACMYIHWMYMDERNMYIQRIYLDGCVIFTMFIGIYT